MFYDVKKFFKKTSDIANNYKKSDIDYGYQINRINVDTKSRFIKDANVWKQVNPKLRNSVDILCAGDLMCEPAMSEASYFDGEYDFRTCFKYIRPVLKSADLALANLETMVTELVPYAHEIHRVKHFLWKERYHCNAPVAYLNALRYAGFDGFAMANNHSADAGYDGLIDTINNVDKYGFMHTGVFKDEKEPRCLIVEVNGIKLGILSYTEHINRDLDKEVYTEDGSNVLMNRFSTDKIKKDVEYAKNNGVEFLLCYIHFIAKEYSHEVIQRQRDTAQSIADAGVDCIMGSHSHSIQPYDKIKAFDGRMVPVVYSLGNFITSDNTSMITRKNIIYRLVLTKKNGAVSIERESFIPCRVVEDTLRSGFKVFPTQEVYHKGIKSELLNKAQDEICAVVGSLDLDGSSFISNNDNKNDILNYDFNKLDINMICNITGIENVNSNINLNQRINYFTARYTWVRKGCAYFSRYLGNVEEQEARWAYSRGASVLFCSKQFTTEDGKPMPCIVVPDPAQRFYKLSRWMRLKFPIPTIGVTGSVGKTTTKEIVYQVLSSKYKTIKNIGNANTYAAIADTIQKLDDSYQVYIQEICAFSPGWVEGGSFMLAPDMCIITNIGYPHIDLYGSIENILYDKTSLIRNLPDNGVAFLNYDDKRLFEYKTDKKVISFAIHNKNANYIAEEIKYEDGFIDFKIRCEEGLFPARIYMVGEHNVLNALAAFAVGRYMAIPVDDILSSLSEYRSEGMRQNVLNVGGYNLYMDCYNSAPNSVLTSVHALAIMHTDAKSKKIAILGDIPRLGKQSEQIHKEVAEKLIGEKIDLYLLYGPYMKYMYDVMKSSGCNAKYTDSREELNNWIKDNVQRGDIVLFKAGHPMALAKTSDQVFGTSFHITDGDVLLDNSKSADTKDYEARWIDGVIEIRKAIKKETRRIIPAYINEVPVVRIGNEAFSNGKMEYLELPETLRNIGYAAFYKCQSLKHVKFSEGLLILERSAFNSCLELNEVVLPETLIEIGKRAFADCINLRNIYMPNSVGNIYDDAFEGCKNLIIKCNKDSYAYDFAIKKGIPIEIVNE